MGKEHSAEKNVGVCVRATTLREVITEALADAERTGMTGQTRDEWVSIAILGSSRIPLHSHFPPEGGGPCPWCGTHLPSHAESVIEHDEWCPINGCRCGKCGPCLGPPLCVTTSAECGDYPAPCNHDPAHDTSHKKEH